MSENFIEVSWFVALCHSSAKFIYVVFQCSNMLACICVSNVLLPFNPVCAVIQICIKKNSVCSGFSLSSLFSLIDCFLLDSAAVSLTMSPTGDFLATAHVDDLGIYLW